jgi:integrase
MKRRTKYLEVHHGRVCFRLNGKRTELPEKGSPEFDAAYDRLFAEAQRTKAARKEQNRQRAEQHKRNTKGGIASVEWFIQKFLVSEFFIGQHDRSPLFAPGTQKNYRPVLERMCLDTVKGMAAPIGKAKLAEFTPKTARTYLHKVAEHNRPTVARTQLILLSNLWQFAMRFDEFDPDAQTNPFVGIGQAAFYTVEQEHEPWPEDVIERFLASCDENLYFAFYLLLCTGQRVSDICAMKWSQYDGTRIALTQIKTKKSNDPMRIRVPDVLKVLLDRRERVHEHILTHKWDRPYTRDSLGHRIKEVLIANGDGDYTVRGLRKNAGIMLAENGATVPMIMAALGHKSPKLALYYTRLADQAKLSDQAAEVVNMVFNRRAAAKDAKAKARRAQIREVKNDE